MCTRERVAALLRNSNGEVHERTEQLKEVLSELHKETDKSGRAAVVEALADGARDASWRLPIGESGLLDFVLASVPVTEPRHPLNKHALRLVGNSCADCDENRARVVRSGALRTFIIHIIEDPSEDDFLPFATAAALNLCLDYTPAQQHASEAGLSRVLVDLVSGERGSSGACQSSLSRIMTILELLSNQDAEPKTANPNTPALLLGLATSERYDADLDSFLEICTPALAYLTLQDLQRALLQNGGIELLQLAFHQLYTRFDTTEAASETADQLKQVVDAFLTVFADISSLPEFSSTYPLDSAAVQTFVDWLNSPSPLFYLQTAACLCLGNLGRSDESSISLIPRVQRSLVDIVSRAAPPALSSRPAPETPTPPLQLTHAALGFLKNLAIPQANKPVLGAALLDPSNPLLPRLWTSTRTQPQLQFAALLLTRILLVNCPANIRHLCAPTTTNNTQGSSSSSSSNSSNNSKSNLALLTATAASADEDPIKVEAARAATQVCRALHAGPVADVLDRSWTWPSSSSSSSSSSSTDKDGQKENPAAAAEEEEEALRARFYAAHGPDAIVPSLRRLLTHPRFPVVRSEAVLALALMSRSPEGARVALRVLRHSAAKTQTDGDSDDGAGWQAVARAIAGSDSEELAAALKGSSTAALPVEGAGEDGEEEKKKEGEEGGGDVTVEELSAELQVVDFKGYKQQQQQQPIGLADMDRENAMVLVAELLRRFPEALSGLRKPLERLLSKGGEMLAKDRRGRQQQ
ncbi:hypothetical protein VTH06DRAFT_7230 [Thermothelomyces fergusii]